MEALATLENMLKAFPPRKPKPDNNNDDPSYPSSDRATPPEQDGSDGGGDGPGDSDPAPDNDNDGMPDDQDPDDDNDAVPDEEDPDADGNGVDDADELPPGQGMDQGQPGANGGDGNLKALAEQVVQAERDFYAALGFHGSNHHNTQRAMDTFHRIIRKFVRAASGGQVSDDMSPQQAAAGGAPGQEGAAPGKPPPGGAPPGQPPEEGDDAAPDDEDDAYEGDDAFDENEGDGDAAAGQPGQTPQPGDEVDMQSRVRQKRFGKSLRAMEHGYRVFAQKHGLEAFLGLRKAVPAGDGWTYPPADDATQQLAGLLQKGTWEFQDTNDSQAVPDQFLMPYLIAFIEAAYQDVCSSDTSCENNLERSAPKIMLRLVTMIPRSSNLKRAAQKYKITEEGISKILKDRGIVPVAAAEAARYASTPRDADSFAAMNANGLAEASIGFGKSDWYRELGREADHTSTGQVVHLAPARSLTKLVDDRAAPSRVQAVRPIYSDREAIVKANVSRDCAIHSKDLSKSDMLTHSFAKCVCPR